MNPEVAEKRLELQKLKQALLRKQNEQQKVAIYTGLGVHSLDKVH